MFSKCADTVRRTQFSAEEQTAFQNAMPRMAGPMGDLLTRIQNAMSFYGSGSTPGMNQYVFNNHLYSHIPSHGAGSYNIRQPGGGNGNREFPWVNPAGMDGVANAGPSFKFAVPPTSGPMVHVRTVLPMSKQDRYYGAIFNDDGLKASLVGASVLPGTIGGEVLTVKAPGRKSVSLRNPDADDDEQRMEV